MIQNHQAQTGHSKTVQLILWLDPNQLSQILVGQPKGRLCGRWIENDFARIGIDRHQVFSCLTGRRIGTQNAVAALARSPSLAVLISGSGIGGGVLGGVGKFSNVSGPEVQHADLIAPEFPEPKTPLAVGVPSARRGVRCWSVKLSPGTRFRIDTNDTGIVKVSAQEVSLQILLDLITERRNRILKPIDV